MYDLLIESAVKKRKINYVVHFTRLENLDSIHSYGIMPRQLLELHSDNIKYNDSVRLDGQKEASCFSITHPNYKMFYKLRQQDYRQEWIVIVCKADILWIKDCAFCYENAASSNITKIPIQERKGIIAFEELFIPIIGKPSREELGLPDFYPTNPQAEVLIFDIVEPKYILGVAYKHTHKSFFDARLDYEYW